MEHTKGLHKQDNYELYLQFRIILLIFANEFIAHI